MKLLVTGSAGHLGEALVLHFREQGHEVIGLDILPSPSTTHVGSITDGEFVRTCLAGAHSVLHTATLHKPHVGSHTRQQFLDVNLTGTLNLLEAALEAGTASFIFTSTTSAFGDALSPPPGEPAAWITEAVMPRPKNIYGATKTAAEDLCQLFARNEGLPCLVLRTSRFFPEGDDDDKARSAFEDNNLKTNEFLYRRVDIADVVDAHQLAISAAPQLRFDRFIISATTPFLPEDLAELRHDPAAVMRRRVPRFEAVYGARGWRAPPSLDRVYVNSHARERLGWCPRFDFDYLLDRLEQGLEPRSELARQIGRKGYHHAGPPPGKAFDYR